MRNLEKEQNRGGQKALYEMFSAKMLAIANSYVNNIHDAEDILMNSFLPAFLKLTTAENGKASRSGCGRLW